MNFKRGISTVLALAMMFNAAPIQTLGEENILPDSTETTVASTEIEEINMSEDTVSEIYKETVQNNNFAEINLKYSAISDTSISIFWDSVDYVAYYEINCNGTVYESDVISTDYTLSNLEGGSEYFISVNAYNEDGILVGTSNEICVYTDLIIRGDTVLNKNITVENLYINSGVLNVNGYTITVKNDLYIGNGTLYVNGGNIYVEKNFYQKSTNSSYSYGYLKMINPNDYISVNGDYYCYAYYTKHHLKFGKNQTDNLEYIGFRCRFFPVFFWCLVLQS